ncbi:hypothetical protein OG612_00480 [Streptomyces sp. NBC_01527]|uniref:hypothetical protein n=1 Tax=Streptomyces sp. NBC_01527 TaxID=2903894 RepID=UPI0038664487
MNPYEGLATVERMDGTLVRVWAEVAVAQEHNAADPDRPPWTARLTAPGGEALLLKGDLTLVLGSRTRWPAEVTYTQLSSGPHSANWTEIKGTGPATTRPDTDPSGHADQSIDPQPGTAHTGEPRQTIRQPKPKPDHDGTS